MLCIGNRTTVLEREQMRIHKPLNKILDSSLKISILRLFCRTNKQMNGREIARELNATVSLTHLTLHELEVEGILTRRVIGKMHIYNLKNSAWLIDRLLKPLFKEEDKLSQELVKTIEKHIEGSKLKESILSVVIFGSIYNQLEEPNSDVDLFIVIQDGRSKRAIENLIFELDKEMFPKTGLSLEPHINSLSEFKKKYEDKLPLIREIIKGNKVCYGQNLEVLL